MAIETRLEVFWISVSSKIISLINPLKTELNPICYMLALLGAYHFLHVSRIRVKRIMNTEAQNIGKL